jgi:4'-phosphopantetheinyl transferase
MISVALKIHMIREKHQFDASVGIVKGTLSYLEQYLNRLHSTESMIYQKIKYDLRKKSYLLGRLSAKEAILNLIEGNTPDLICIDSGVFHFPVVSGQNIQNIQVSISHCENIGMSIAFPEGHPMGVDIEKIDSNKLDVILSQITEREKRLVERNVIDDTTGMYSIFSAKEALSKIIRTGMMIDFRFLEVDSFKEEQGWLKFTFTHFGQYQALIYPLEAFVISFVLPKRTSIQQQQLHQLKEKVDEGIKA